MQHTNMVEIIPKYKSQKIEINKLKPISNYTQYVDILINFKKINENYKLVIPNSIKNVIHYSNCIFKLNVVTNNIQIYKIIKLSIHNKKSNVTRKFIMNAINIHSFSVCYSYLNLKNLLNLEHIHYLEISHVNKRKINSLCIKNIYAIQIDECFKNINIFKNIHTLQIPYINLLPAQYNLCNVHNLYTGDARTFNIESLKNIYKIHLNLDNDMSHHMQHLKNICVVVLSSDTTNDLSVLDTVHWLHIDLCSGEKIIDMRYANLFLY